MTEYQEGLSLAIVADEELYGHRVRRDPAGCRVRRAASPSRADPLPELPDAVPDVLVLDEDGGEAPLTAEHPARLVADALAVLALARARPNPGPPPHARSCVPSTAMLARLDNAATVTVHDLSTVVEASLIAAGYYEVAKALVLRRACRRRRRA